MSEGEPLARIVEEIPYPMLNPAFVPVQVNPDTVHIRVGPWTGPVYTIQDHDHEAEISEFFGCIDGSTHVSDLLEQLKSEVDREEVASLLLDLHDRDILYDRDREVDGVWPHLVLRRRFGQRERRNLSDRSVAIVDCGGLGTQVAADLTSAGVSDVGLFRPVEPETQTQPDPPTADPIELDDISVAVDAADFVVYIANRPYPQIADDIDRACAETGTPWSTAQVHGVDGIVGPTVFPGETACYRCFRERMMANVANQDGYRAFASDGLTPARLPGLGRMVAGYLSLDLVNLLAFGTGYTAGRVISVDGLGLSVECNDVLKLPRCEVCGSARTDVPSPYIDVDDVMEASTFSDRGMD